MPYDTEDLPELGGSPRDKLKPWLESMRAWKDPKLTGSVGDMDYELSRKGLQLQAEIQDAMLRAQIRPSGWNLRATKPMWGGEVNLNASGGQGDPRYEFQYQRNF